MVALARHNAPNSTRGFISTTTISKGRDPPARFPAGLGFTANAAALLPPVSTTARMIAIAASRIAWYSLSDSVGMGHRDRIAGVDLMASMFSMPQTIDAVVLLVADDLELVLLPPDDRLVDAAPGGLMPPPVPPVVA